MNITTLTPEQFRTAADLKENIDALQEQLNAILGGDVPGAGATQARVAPGTPRRPKNGRRKRRRKISPEGRANISAAAKARWAARRMAKQGAKLAAEPEPPVGQPRTKRSASWSRALSVAMKARWAKAKRAGKSRL
jgi:hypothetical protein